MSPTTIIIIIQNRDESPLGLSIYPAVQLMTERGREGERSWVWRWGAYPTACLSKKLFQNQHSFLPQERNNCNVKRPSITGAIRTTKHSCAHLETRRFLARSVLKLPPSSQRENGALSHPKLGVALHTMEVYRKCLRSIIAWLNIFGSHFHGYCSLRFSTSNHTVRQRTGNPASQIWGFWQSAWFPKLCH